MRNPGTPSPREADAPFDLDEAYAEIRAAVDATPASRVRTGIRVAGVQLLIPIVSAAVVWAAARLVYRRPVLRFDLGKESIAHLLVVLGGLVALTVLATFVAVRRGPRGFGSSVVSLLAVAGMVVPAYAALTLAGAVASQGLTAAESAALSQWGLPCLSIAATVGVLVLVGYAFALRRAVPSGSGSRGAALGAAAGAWAGLGVFLFCPATDLQHLLVGHVLPVLALTLVGTIALPRALRP